ncbi:hypothetical protein BDN72DRAFT_841560, partial [Pluteus cervinus]
MSLPTEILLAIIKIIREEEKATLKPLSLASPIFRDLCQQLLFEAVQLQNDVMAAGSYDQTVPPGFLTRFHSVVTQSPRIASYVRKLEIGQYSIPPSGGIRDREPAVLMMWMLDHPGLLTAALDVLAPSMIHTLSITSRRKIYWTELDEGLRKSLLRIVQNPTFQNITLEGVGVPGHFFSDFIHLHSVRLYNPLFPKETWNMPPSTHTHQISQLTFRVHADPGIYSMPNTLCVGPIIGLDLSQLTSLDLDLDRCQLPHVAHFFRLANLTDLRIATSRSFPPLNPPPTIDLSGLHALKRLTLCMNSFNTTSDEPFHQMGDALTSLTGVQRRRLEAVTIELLTTSSTLQAIRNFHFMRPLSQALSFLHHNSDQLRRILVHLKISWGDNGGHKILRDVIWHSLAWQGCDHEGVLDIQVESTLDWLYRNRSSTW